MRNGLFALVVLLVALPVQAADVIITGVMDGPLSGGTPKAIELYVTADGVDLSAYGVGSANNGGGSGGEELALVGTASAGDFIYIAAGETPFGSVFGFAPDFVHSVANINGNDAVELFHEGAPVDVFGDIATDGTDEAWEYLDSWAYRADGSGPDGTVFATAAWTFGGVDALDGMSAAATAAAVPFGTYAAATVPVPGALWLLAASLPVLMGSGLLTRRR